MIKGSNIHKYFNNLHVLKGVNINIKQGEFVSIVILVSNDLKEDNSFTSLILEHTI